MNLPKYDRYVYMLFAGDAPLPFYLGIGKHGTGRHEMLACREKSNPAKNQFLRECKAAGIKIRYIVPETCLTIDEASLVERELISSWGRRELGGCLFNMSGGGCGGRDPAPSTRAKMSAARRRRKILPETCAKISAANRGKKRSPECCARIGARRLGKKLSPEHVAKMAAAQRGKKHSAGTRAKISAATHRRHADRVRSPDQCELTL